MTEDITRLKTPEDEILEKKLAELDALEDELARLELDLQQLKRDVAETEYMYHQNVTARFIRLSEIRAQIQELLGEEPEPEETEQPVEDPDFPVEAPAPQKVEPNDEIKQLYRDLAKKFHPDLAEDEEDRSRRTVWMSEINTAYQSGDLDRLRQIWENYRTSPERVSGNGQTARLVRTLRKSAQVQRRMLEIRNEMENLRNSSAYQLKTKMQAAGKRGLQWLEKICSQIDDQIEQEEKYLMRLLRKQARTQAAEEKSTTPHNGKRKPA